MSDQLPKRSVKINYFNPREENSNQFVKSQVDYYSNQFDMIDEPVIFGVTSSTVKETTLERIERKLDEYRKEVDSRNQLIYNKERELSSLREELASVLEDNTAIQEQVDILRDIQKGHVIHKRLEKYSLGAFIFFAISFLSRVFLNEIIVQPFWNSVGLFFSFGFLLMSWLLGLDWKDRIK